MPTLTQVTEGRWLVEHPVVPVRNVEVEAGGRWWPGMQHAWRMYAHGTGRRAAVRFVAAGPVGVNSHDLDVPVTRLRERAGTHSAR